MRGQARFKKQTSWGDSESGISCSSRSQMTLYSHQGTLGNGVSSSWTQFKQKPRSVAASSVLTQGLSCYVDVYIWETNKLKGTSIKGWGSRGSGKDLSVSSVSPG